MECQLRSVAWRDSARPGSRPAAAPATSRTCRTTWGTWPGTPAPAPVLAPPSPGRRKATLPTRPLLLRTWPVAEDTARGATCVTAVMSPAAAVVCYQLPGWCGRWWRGGPWWRGPAGRAPAPPAAPPSAPPPSAEPGGPGPRWPAAGTHSPVLGDTTSQNIYLCSIVYSFFTHLIVLSCNRFPAEMSVILKHV